MKRIELLLVAGLLPTLGCAFGDRPFLKKYSGHHQSSSAAWHYHELLSFTYWAWPSCLIWYFQCFILPLRRESPTDFGLSLRSVSAVEEKIRLPWARMYLVLLALILPAVFAGQLPASFHPYPFTGKASRGLFDFVVWEAEYLSTFVAVEFFSAATCCFGLRRYLGSLALFCRWFPTVDPY